MNLPTSSNVQERPATADNLIHIVRPTSAATSPLVAKRRSLATQQGEAGGENLTEAFAQFQQMSQQLANSYHQLENRVAELNEELTTDRKSVV